MKLTHRRQATFNIGSIQNLVAVQNKFIQDELVTKLGIVGSGKLDAVLIVDRNLRQRAIACHEAVLDQVAAKVEETEVWISQHHHNDGCGG